MERSSPTSNSQPNPAAHIAKRYRPWSKTLAWTFPLTNWDPRHILEVFQQRWGSAQPATWNTRITALQSFVSYCQRNKWIDHDPMTLVVRRREPRDQTKAIPYQDLEKLWSRRDINLREKTLWRMLYETAARAGEILALDIEDMDLSRKRAVIIGKGGHKEYVFWASGTARLSSRYLAGRRRGPVFLTHRQPNIIPARGDECPHTGRGRLSYERASTIFKQTTGGWTLHTPPLLTHPPRRERSLHHPPPGQEPTPRPTHTRHLHQTGKRSNRTTHLRV